MSLWCCWYTLPSVCLHRPMRHLGGTGPTPRATHGNTMQCNARIKQNKSVTGKTAIPAARERESEYKYLRNRRRDTHTHRNTHNMHMHERLPSKMTQLALSKLTGKLGNLKLVDLGARSREPNHNDGRIPFFVCRPHRCDHFCAQSKNESLYSKGW